MNRLPIGFIGSPQAFPECASVILLTISKPNPDPRVLDFSSRTPLLKMSIKSFSEAKRLPSYTEKGY